MHLSDLYSLDLSGVCLYHFPDWTVSRDAVKRTRHNKTARLVWRIGVEMIFFITEKQTKRFYQDVYLRFSKHATQFNLN